MSFPPFTFRNNIFWHTNKWLNMFGNTKMSNHSLASNHSYIYSPMQRCEPGWQKLCEGTKGLRRKVCTPTKILSANTFCRDIKICRDLRTFWKSLGKKSVVFWSKTVFLGQEVHYYMHIIIENELYLKICNYAQKRRIS